MSTIVTNSLTPDNEAEKENENNLDFAETG
jgi:hypothetical protein